MSNISLPNIPVNSNNPPEYGLADTSTGQLATEAAATIRLIEVMLSSIRTCMPAVIEEIGGDGTISVRPLVQQSDAAGNAISHGVIHGVHVLKFQHGGNAFVIDPQKGDIGLIGICDRDISGVLASGGENLPGSGRKHDMSDAVYIRTLIASAPARYVKVHDGGITVYAPNDTVDVHCKTLTSNSETATINSGMATINCDDIQAYGLSMRHNGLNVGSTHIHLAPLGVTTPPIN